MLMKETHNGKRNIKMVFEQRFLQAGVFFTTIYFQIDFLRTSNWPFKSKYILALYVTTSLHAFLLSFEKPQCKERKAIFCDYLKLDCPTICFHKTESYCCFDPTTYYNSFYGQSFYFPLKCRNKLTYFAQTSCYIIWILIL